jgi:hypothetical protein
VDGTGDAGGGAGGRWVRGGSGMLEWVCGGRGGAGSSGSGFECFFEAVSSCSVGDSGDVSEFTPGSDPFSEAERFWVPQVLSVHGLLWWRAQLAHFLYRPLPDLLGGGGGEGGARAPGAGAGVVDGEGIVERERDEPYVGVHVRRGDKVSEVALAPIEAFAAAAHAIASYGGGRGGGGGGGEGPISHEGTRGQMEVMVVSDETLASETVMRLIQTWQSQQKPHGHLDEPRSTSRGVAGGVGGGVPTGVPKSRSGHLVRDFDGVDIVTMTAQAIRDLWALSRARAQVVTLSSNYGNNFSKVPDIVTLSSTYTRALTLENL